MFKCISFAAVGLLSTLATSAPAQNWTLDAGASHIAFGSIKKDTVGEIHSFETISGRVSADGSAAIEIDLGSVQTLIDVRNERMVEHVFASAPTAKITANIDMDAVSALAIGDSTVLATTGSVALAGNTLDLEADLFVMRVGESRVLVSTHDMIMLSMAEMGLTTGIDKLMEIAELPGITRVSPVTLRLIFDGTGEQATVTGVQTVQAAATGDAEAGKKVFRKCKACHSLAESKNGAGPSLHGILGATAGQTDGFRYSKAMVDSGVVWTAEALAGYLADPKGYMPGNKMAFRGLRKEADIENVIAYLSANN